MTEPIEAVDVTDAVELPKVENTPPIPDKFIARFLCSGSVADHLFWSTTTDWPTVGGAYASARKHTCDPRTIRVYRLGEPKKVAIDWDAVADAVEEDFRLNPPSGVRGMQLVSLAVSHAAHHVESQLKDAN